MPVAVSIRLQAGTPVRPDTRWLHGLACALFEGGDQAVHDGKDKPFTVWPLRPVPDVGQTWDLRAAWLPGHPPPATVAAPAQLRLGPVTCQVAEITHRLVTHATLAAGSPVTRGRLEFSSPAYFAHNGTDVVLPDPRLILGSYRRRWNASLPENDDLVIGDETWQQTHRSATLTEFDLRTARMDSGHGRQRTGFTGTATLRVSKDTPAMARAAFGTLMRFAEFCGTGAQTTHGFGATRVSFPAGE